MLGTYTKLKEKIQYKVLALSNEVIAETPNLKIGSLGSFLKAWFPNSGSQLFLRKSFLPQEKKKKEKASGRAHFFHSLWLG